MKVKVRFRVALASGKFPAARESIARSFMADALDLSCDTTHEIANHPDALYDELFLTSHYHSPRPCDFTRSNEAHFCGEIDKANLHRITPATTNIMKPL